MTIPKAGIRHCEHMHLSGRPCGRRVHTISPFCGLHKAFKADGSTECTDCAAMLAVFPIRRQEKRDGEF